MTEPVETAIVGGTVVTPERAGPATVAIRDGRVAAILPAGEAVRAERVIRADGLLVMPGAIDAHTHFTGSHDRPEEEWREGTRGALRGGVTTVIEMPHSDPPATSLAAFLGKRARLTGRASIDWALWAGLDGRNLGDLPALKAAGAAGFKAFLCSPEPDGRAPAASGLPRLDPEALEAAMRAVAAVDGLVGIHAEDHDLLQEAGARLRVAGRRDTRAHAEAGPEEAEIRSVAAVVAAARRTGARTHVVHVSSGAAAALVAAAGSDRITAETCTHYLLLDEEDLVRVGPAARCGPPLRPRATVAALWDQVRAGVLATLASDHCPYLPAAKECGRDDIWRAGMGLTGIETNVPLFIAAALERGLPLTQVAAMIAGAPARLFRLDGTKGAIAPGHDADIVLYDTDAPWTVRGADFLGLAPWSAFEGHVCPVRPVRALLRGRTVMEDGAVVAEPGFGREIGL